MNEGDLTGKTVKTGKVEKEKRGDVEGYTEGQREIDRQRERDREREEIKADFTDL